VIGSEPRLPPGYRLISYDSVGSTNDEAKRLAREGAPEDTIVWAREQTAGRGRRGRVWVSPRDNLYASLILRPNCPPVHAAQLGFVAALGISNALGTILPGLQGLSYKWPNDVLLNGRKIAGILLESEMTTAGELTFLILGIGVNLLSSPPLTEYSATSVAEEGLGDVPPAAMLEEFCRHFHSWKSRWHNEGFAPVRAAWLARAASLRELIRVRLGAGTLYGQFLDIDELGALLLEGAERQHRISAGEVLLMNQ
jgi:BirA family transcriptional regulator, biotin operon repressor / biotin---[acetyl-CoA-carboxylase] ligase